MMHKPEIWLALAVLAGCGEPPAQGSTESTTTDASPTSGPLTSTTQPDDTTAGSTGPVTSATTGEEVCPPMPPEDGGYDACPGLCGGGGQCFNNGQQYAVCTRGCFMDCNCWPAPADGEAPARCSSALLESTSVCVLDCSAGQACPQGMFCVDDLGICAHPFPGSDDTTGSTSDMGSTGSTSDMGSTGSTSDTGSTGSTSDTGSTGSGSTGMTT